MAEDERKQPRDKTDNRDLIGAALFALALLVVVLASVHFGHGVTPEADPTEARQ